MRVHAFLSVLLLSTLSVAFFSAVPVHAAPTWNIQTIATNSGGPGETAIDSNNNLHIFYGYYEDSSRNSPFHRVYAIWNGSNWNNQPLPPVKGAFNLVLDSNNNPHLADLSIDGLMYVWWTGSNWTIQTVTKEIRGVTGFLALDSTGNPAIAYRADFGLHNNPDGTVGTWQVLKYASWNGSNWDTQTIDSPSYLGGVYLAFDTNNNPIIMYGNRTDYRLPPPNGGGATQYSVKFATWNGSAWNIKTTFNDLDAFGKMALDSKGYPHFLYRKDYPINHGGNSTLSYASWNGSTWNTQIVVSNANLGLGTNFLALDSYDYPHIDYYNGSLVYVGWTGSVWDFQIVGPNSLAIEAGPIAMDSDGNAHIIYTGDPDLTRYFNEKVLVMYATAAQPIYTPTPSSTQTSSPIF